MTCKWNRSSSCDGSKSTHRHELNLYRTQFYTYTGLLRVRVYACTYVRTYVRIYVCTCTRVYVCTCARTKRVVCNMWRDTYVHTTGNLQAL